MGLPGLRFPFIKGDLGGPNFRPSLFFFLFMATWTALITFVFTLKRIRCRFASIERYWDRASRSFFLAALVIFLLSFSSASRAETTPSAELEGILQKIESRHYRWIAIRADVLLFFAKAGDPNAMCGGELLYQRLDERMLLACVDTRQELMFIFRTFDRRFDLYLPSQNTVYHGSIFDMEDSPDIESHLKARDLYRALKPMAVDPRRTKIERTNSAITSLDVYGRSDNQGTLVRKLYLTPEGDVRGELFYNPEERPVTEIQRYEFREIPGRVGSYDSIFFPKKITITSPETKKGSAIFFTHVTPLDTIDPLEFILRFPPGTKEVFLDEKDPRFQSSGTSEGETRLDSKAPRSQKSKTPESEVRLISKATHFSQPRTRQEEKPVETKTSFAMPAEKKSMTPNIPKEKQGGKRLPLPLEEKKATKKISAPQTAPVEASPTTAKLEEADADLVVDNPSPASDNQTTLDPSVDPTA